MLFNIIEAENVKTKVNIDLVSKSKSAYFALETVLKKHKWRTTCEKRKTTCENNTYYNTN